MEFTVLHADHAITDAQQEHINSALSGQAGGFFIRQIAIPSALGTVPCGLHGPAMGDEPVPDAECRQEARGGRDWTDRLCGREPRQVDYVQAIGIRDGDSVTLFTVYGGALAPQNPEDPTNSDPEAARIFWAEHALSA